MNPILAYTVVSQTTGGAVVFTPGALVLPMVTAVIATITAVCAIVLVCKGSRLVFDVLRDRDDAADRAAERRRAWDSEPHFESWADNVGWGTDEHGNFNRHNEKLGPGF